MISGLYRSLTPAGKVKVFIPEQARTYLGLDTVGVAEFFALLYIAYEVVSIFKNMQRQEKPQEREYLPLWK